MWRRLFVCLLVATAGCNALDGRRPVEQTATVTPAPVPAEETLAPGVDSTGVVNPRALADAHADALAESSYQLSVNQTVRYANGTLRERLTLELALAADRGYLVDTETAGPAAPVFLGSPPANATFWSNGSTYARKLTRDGQTTYNQFRPAAGAGTWQYWARTVPFGGGTGSPRDFIENTFTAANTRIVNRSDSYASSVYVVVANATNAPFDPEYVDPTNVSLRATITPEGLVRSVRLRYDATAGGEPVTVRRTVRYRNLGNTTAPRPPWVERVST